MLLAPILELLEKYNSSLIQAVISICNSMFYQKIKICICYV